MNYLKNYLKIFFKKHFFNKTFLLIMILVGNILKKIKNQQIQKKNLVLRAAYNKFPDIFSYGHLKLS